MYSSKLGRFLQPDPIGYYDSANLYQYVGNNPVNYRDPMGLCKETILDKIKEWLKEHGYLDVNVSGSLPWWVGITGGFQIDAQGNIHGYFGGGAISPPGGASISGSPNDITPGWGVGAQAGYWGGGQVGYSFGNSNNEGGPYVEGGFVTPGGSLTGYYIW